MSCMCDCQAFKARHRKKKWYVASVIFLKLVLHFSIVMMFLFIGTIVFVYIEDPILPPNYVKPVQSRENFVKETSKKYGIPEEILRQLNDTFFEYHGRLIDHHVKSYELQINKDRNYIFEKWFYFTNIVATTIGR